MILTLALIGFQADFIAPHPTSPAWPSREAWELLPLEWGDPLGVELLQFSWGVEDWYFAHVWYGDEDLITPKTPPTRRWPRWPPRARRAWWLLPPGC